MQKSPPTKLSHTQAPLNSPSAVPGLLEINHGLYFVLDLRALHCGLQILPAFPPSPLYLVVSGNGCGESAVQPLAGPEPVQASVFLSVE